MSLECAICPANPKGHRVRVKKERWGHWLWQHLNHAAVNFSPSYFVSLVDCMLHGPLIPCPECREEFKNVVAQEGAYNAGNSREACAWVFRVHNKINARLGKPQYTWKEAMRDYGFPQKVNS